MNYTKFTVSEDEINMSESPKRWAHTTRLATSPTRNIHAETETGRMAASMKSIHNQPDFGHRTTDFFEDSSDDERTAEPRTAITAPDEISRTSKYPVEQTQPHTPRYEPSKATTQAVTDNRGYIGLNPDLAHQSSQGQAPGTATALMSSLSVDEMESLNSQEVDDSQPQSPVPARLSSTHTRLTARPWERDANQNLNARASATFSDMIEADRMEQRLEVHAMAYDILLRGLLADEELMCERDDHSPVESPAVRPSGFSQVQVTGPGSPTDDLFPRAGPITQLSQDFSAHLARSPRKPHISLPPIQTDDPPSAAGRYQVHHGSYPTQVAGQQRLVPIKTLRTPYPYDQVLRRNFNDSPFTISPNPGQAESILTLSIRKTNPNSIMRLTTVSIPGDRRYFYTTVHSKNGGTSSEKRSPKQYDDAQFFAQLQKAYKSLTSIPIRLLSARVLTRIVVSGPASRAADAGYGWLHQPQSPRVLASKGLMDPFSEEKIISHYRRPEQGKGRFAFVHWAHRIAAASAPASLSEFPPNTAHETDDDARSRERVRKLDQPQGLEFVVSWSVSRISLALLLVVVLSLAGVLLWTFLGSNRPGPRPPHGGFLDAGDRVGTGILVGICVFWVGMGGFAGWLGVSWLIM